MEKSSFTNLFEISAHDLAPQLDERLSADLRAALFTDGVDVQLLCKGLQQRVSEDGRSGFNRERKRLEQEHQKAQEACEVEERKRQQNESDWQTHESLCSVLRTDETELASCSPKRDELHSKQQTHERWARREQLRKRAQLLEQQELSAQEYEKMPLFHSDQESAWEKLEQVRREAQTAVDKAQGADEAGCQASQQAQQAQQEATQRWSKMQPAVKARCDFSEIAEHRAPFWKRVLCAWNWWLPLSLFSGGLFALPFFGKWAEAPSGPGLVLFFNALVAFATLAALATLFSLWFLPQQQERAGLREALRQWNAKRGEETETGAIQNLLRCANWNECRQALDEVRREQLSVEQESTRRNELHKEAAQKLSGAEQERKEPDRNLKKAQEACAIWLLRFGTESIKAYREQVQRAATCLSNKESYQSQLQEQMEQERFDRENEWQEQWKTELHALKQEQLLQPFENAAQFAQHREELRKLNERIDTLNDQIQKTTQKKVSLVSELKGREEGLSSRIAEAAEQKRSAEAALRTMDEDRSAAECALQLLNEIKGQQSRTLGSLASAVSHSMSQMRGLKQVQESAVELETLEMKGSELTTLHAEDQQGVKRSVGHLSSGTRQILFLALRLELARAKRQGQPALFCLDEPFALLDAERRRNALRWLKEYTAELPWQLLWFTHDPLQAEELQNVFPDSRRFDLQLAQRGGNP